MSKYKLKEGVILKPFGKDSLISNENLTDAIAEHLIESGKAKEEDFIIEQTEKPNKKQK
jgi:hypothetical protein